MNRNIVRDAQKYIYFLLNYTRTRSLMTLSKDSCSELSRLLGIWFKKKLPKAHFYIAKGKIKNFFHDLLLIEHGSKIYAFDPSIWQFYKHKKNILISSKNNLDLMLKFLRNFYGGHWKITEKNKKYSIRQINKFIRIIQKNIK